MLEAHALFYLLSSWAPVVLSFSDSVMIIQV